MTSSSHPDMVHPSLASGAILQKRYRIVRQLGRGGMGAVYEATDQRLGITVALKETLSSEESTRKQFEHEARLLAGMQHPALPRVSDHFVEGDRAFLVMEFISGVDLARIIAQQPGPFPRDRVIVWADQLLDALIYLHSRDRQVIHRDIKPHNLKLTASGQIVLLDFGLAKAQPADTSVTASRGFFGYSRHYAPLEQIQDQRTDPRSDIYALGATLYHLLTGTKPPDALLRATALLNGDPDPLQPANKIHTGVGLEISTILSKAMAQKSEDRYASAGDFREALRLIGRNNLSSRETVNAVGGRTLVNESVRSEASPLKLPMIVSSRRFGPGAITTAVVAALVLVAGIIYGSQKWIYDSGNLDTAASSTTSATQRQTTSLQKNERSRNVETTQPVKRTKSTESPDVTTVDKPASASAVNSPTDSGKKRRQSTTQLPKIRRPNAPSIRLPNPEFTATPVSDLR